MFSKKGILLSVWVLYVFMGFSADSFFSLYVSKDTYIPYSLTLTTEAEGAYGRYPGQYAAYTPFSALSEENPLRLAFAGDPHFGDASRNPEATWQILNTLQEATPSFRAFFLLGDLVESGFLEKQWVSLVDTLKGFPWLPIIPLKGNHDNLLNGGGKFLEYMMPDFSKEKDGNPFWQRFDFENVHVLKLNLMWGTEDWNPETQQWLESQLSSIPQQDWVIVVSHCFMYSSGNYRFRVPWFDHPETTTFISPILEKYNVDLSIAGHNHQMEFLEKAGVHYVVVGTLGGALENSFDKISEFSLWYLQGSFGYLDLMITPSKMVATFRDTQGSLLREFIIE